MYRGVTTTTTKNNNDTKKRRKQKRRDTEENAFHIIARCKESYKNPLETLKFMLEECFTQQQDEDDSLLLETLLSQKGRRKGGKRRRDSDIIAAESVRRLQFSDKYIIRPVFRKGKEIMIYDDSKVFHSAPDYARRESLWRFM